MNKSHAECADKQKALTKKHEMESLRNMPYRYTLTGQKRCCIFIALIWARGLRHAESTAQRTARVT